MFEIAFEVGWFDCDANRHLKNTAFLEYAIEARFRYFHEHGFPASAFAEHQIGPVVVKDEITYKRELHLLDKFRVQFLSAGINESGTRNLVVKFTIQPLRDPIMNRLVKRRAATRRYDGHDVESA